MGNIANLVKNRMRQEDMAILTARQQTPEEGTWRHQVMQMDHNFIKVLQDTLKTSPLSVRVSRSNKVEQTCVSIPGKYETELIINEHETEGVINAYYVTFVGNKAFIRMLLESSKKPSS